MDAMVTTEDRTRTHNNKNNNNKKCLTFYNYPQVITYDDGCYGNILFLTYRKMSINQNTDQIWSQCQL